jgi:drug/metabolite transporter (DMT)-like permease
VQTWLLFSGCIVAWGVAIFLMKLAGSAIGPYTSIVFTLPGSILAAAFVMPKADYTPSKWHWIPPTVGVLYVVGNLAFYKLCATTDISRLGPATSLYVAIPIVLGWMVLREPVTMQRVIGIVLAAAALYFLTAPEKAMQH